MNIALPLILVDCNRIAFLSPDLPRRFPAFSPLQSFPHIFRLEFTPMHLRPLHDRIIVQRLEDAQRTGAIVIPDSAKEKPLQGKVLAAGLGKSKEDGTRLALDVKPGDTILFGKYAGQEVSVDGVDYLIMKEEDVLAIQERSL
jgi:chaperonin GroES